MMAAAFEPYAPLNILKPVAQDIWIADGPEIRMDYIGFKLPFPTRMTVVRLSDGGVWVHSPIAPDIALMDAVAALGPVTCLIAPNSIHYWFVPDWAEYFPDAKVHAVPGLSQRAKRTLPPHTALSDAPDPDWQKDIDQVLVKGGLITEVDFFHRPTKTLILTDLIENFEPVRVRSRTLRSVMRLAGAADPDGKAPLDMQWSFRRHRPQVRRAVLRMLAWAPERIILAHGRWYDHDGVAELKRAFRWVL